MWRRVREVNEPMLEHTEMLPEMGGQSDALEMLEMPAPAPAPPLSPVLTTRDLATGRADGSSNAGSPDSDATPSMLMSSPALVHGLMSSLSDSLKTLPVKQLDSAVLVYACLLPPDEAGAGSVVVEDEEAAEMVAQTEAQMHKHLAHGVGSPLVSVQLSTGTHPAAMPAESVGNEAKASLPLGYLVTPPGAAKPGSACAVGAPVRPCAHATSHANGAPTTNGMTAEDDEVAAVTRGHSLGIRRPPSPRHAMYAPPHRSPMLISGRVSPRLARGLPGGPVNIPFAPRSQHSPRPGAHEIIGTPVVVAVAESAAHEVTEAEVEAETDADAEADAEANAEAELSTFDPVSDFTVKYIRISPFPGGIATECERTVACPVMVKRAVLTPPLFGARFKFATDIAAAAAADAVAADVATHAAKAATLLVLDPRLSMSRHLESAAGSTEMRAQPLEHTRERTSVLKRQRVHSPSRDVLAKTRSAHKTAFLQPLRDALQEARTDWRELYRSHHTRHMPRCLQSKYPRWSPRGLLEEPPHSQTARNTSLNTPLSLNETAFLLTIAWDVSDRRLEQ